MTLLKTGRGPRCTIWGDQPAASSLYFAHTYAICTYIYRHCDPMSSSSHKGKYTIHRSCGIYIYIYTYSQENSWKNQLTKSSSIKRGHYLTYLANPNNGLFVWGKPFKITIHLCSVWSTSKQVLSKDPCQKASTSWKTTAQTSRFPNAKKVVLGFACSMLKKRFQKYSPKGWFDGDEYHGRISDKITNLTNPSDTHQLF